MKNTANIFSFLVYFMMAPFCALADLGSEDAIEEVFVYGKTDLKEINGKTLSVTKTLTDILLVPQSVVLLDKKTLRDQDHRTLSDALVNISNVSKVSASEALVSGYKIRGFNANLYYDGLPAYSTAAASDPSSLINVERIEVVKGPTSTLYGGGTGAGVGGMINIVTKSPTFTPFVTFGFRGGSFSTRNPFFDLNHVLSENTALRLTGSYQQADSYIDQMESQTWSINPSLRLKWSASTDLVVKVQQDRRQYLEYSGLPAIGTIEPALYDINPTRFSGATNAPDTTVKNTVVTAHLNHIFSDWIVGSIAARYYKNKFEEYTAFPSEQVTNTIADINALLFGTPTWDAKVNSSYAVTDGYLPAENSQYNINSNVLFRFTHGGLSHQLLLGIEYDKTSNKAELFFDNFCEVSSVGLTLLSNPFDPQLQAEWLAVVNSVPYLDISNANDDIDYATRSSTDCFGFQDNTYSTKGFYLQDQIGVSEKLYIDIGLRWADIVIEEDGNNTQYSEEEVIGRFGVTYRATPSLSFFVGFGQGIQAPLNVFSLDAELALEESDSWELGLKWRTENGSVGSITWFDLQRSHVSTADPANPGFSIQVGEQTSRGIEFDTVWKFDKQISLLANYAYIDAKVTEDTTLPKGDYLARVAKNSARLSARYEFANSLQGLAVQFGVTYWSDMEITLPNVYSVDSTTIYDMQLSYQWRDYQALLSFSNLTDKEYFLPNGYLGLNRVEPGPGQAIFVSVEANFN